MKNVILTIFTILILSGCAINYSFDGQKYASKELFLKAVEDKVGDTLTLITPLSPPLSSKKLIMAMPSLEVYNKLGIENFIKINKKEPNSIQIEVSSNINRSAYLTTKIFLDAVQKKNIYRETQFIDMQSGTDSFAPSANVDVLYLVFTDANSVQWYFATNKNGKEIFGYDRSAPTMAGKVQAFLDAVQTRAIRQ
jgi:hypothetical protein